MAVYHKCNPAVSLCEMVGIRRAQLSVAVVLCAMVWSAAPAAAQAPRAPQAVGAISPQNVAVGGSASLDLAAYFSDPDGDALAYAATVSDVAIATISMSGSILTITGVQSGTAVVTVLTSDPGGLPATQSIQITVEARNRAPELVGTIPGQTLGPGQWVSISVSSYFRDPEGEALSFAATTSNASVASVAVSGDVVTIRQAGPGSAMVNAVAGDPGGLLAQQTITVAGSLDAVAPAPGRPGNQPPEAVRPEPAPPEPPQAERPRPPAPPQAERPRPPAPATAEAAAVEVAIGARQPDPFPPRLLAGFVGSTGHTLARGQGHVSVGYLGASPLAQVGDFGDVWPSVAQASYGVTDDLTVTAGSGFFYYNVGSGDSDLFPYVAPKYHAWDNEQVSVAVEGYVGFWLAEENATYYAGSVAGSMAVDRGFSLHASGGMLGVSSTISGRSQTEQLGVFAVGGDYRVTPEVGLGGEFRRVGFQDGTNVVTAGLRFLQTPIAAEAGLAYYLEDEAEIRPIVSFAYRF